MCEQLLQQQKRKGFLHCIMNGDEKWIHYKYPKRRISWSKPGYAFTSAAKPNIHSSKLLLGIWRDQLSVVYNDPLKLIETITRDCYRLRLMRLSRKMKKKRPLYEQGHDKLTLQHDNARPHVTKRVKTYSETFKREAQQSLPYSPDFVPSDYHLFRSIAHGLAKQRFHSYEDLKKSVDSWLASKKRVIFPTWNSNSTRKMGKSSG